MQTDENHQANSPSPASDHDDSSSKFQLSAKLTDKLEKLARWRLSPSLIKFPKSGPEFRGGYATVSQAFLTSSSHSETESYDTGDELTHSNSQYLKPKDPAEKQEQEFDGGISEGQKAVAVKKMRIKDDPGRVLGLTLREAEFLVELEHQNIIALEGFVEDVSNDIIWLVFPWEGNGTLKTFIASREWEIPERVSLIDDVVGGVEYLHSCKPSICHGDLKSINVMVNSECRALITDFGSARRLIDEDSGENGERAASKLQDAMPLEATFCASTNTISLTGNQYTLRWAAPELLLEDQSSLRSDIWALGWVAYEVMTNSIPFQDVKDFVVIKRVIQGDLPSIAGEARIMMIQALCSLMAKCWSIDPTKRPTAEECRKSITWMPMIVPNSSPRGGGSDSEARSPELLMQLGRMYEDQNDYFIASKFFGEALEIYTGIGDQDGKADALWGLAHMQGAQDEFDQATSTYTEALQIYTDIGNKRGRADTLVGLSMMHRFRDEYDQALSLHYEALEILTEIGDKDGRSNTLYNIAGVHRLQGRYNLAVTLYSEAIGILSDIGNKADRAVALNGLAGVHKDRSEFAQAITLYTQALEDHADTGDTQGRAVALWGLGDVHRARNEYSQANALFSEALNILTDIGDGQGRAAALGGLADVHRLRNEYDEAVALYSEALEILSNTSDRQGKACALWGLADVRRLQDEYDKATALYSEALKIQTDIGDKRGRAATLRGLADVHRLQNEYDQAATLYQEAIEIQADIGDRRARACALGGLADVHRIRNEYRQAIALCSEVWEIATDIGDRSRQAYVLSGLADVYRDRGDYGDAIQQYEQAAGIFRQLGHARDTAYVSEQAADIRRRLEQKPIA